MSRRQKKQKSPNKSTSKNTNSLRIIAGQWRGRKLSFATAPGLRPTPDRVRETLFNWLQGHLHNARCLDLFSGSGALAFEALSRGVEHVTLVENNRDAVTKLRENIQLLNTDKADLIQKDAFQYLKSSLQPFELIFLDPPFRKGYLSELLKSILEKDVLVQNGLIYLEHEKEENLDGVLERFEILREKKAGQVVSLLVKIQTT